MNAVPERRQPGAGEPHLPTHPVLDLIRDRVASGSKPLARGDGAHLALAIEGGGMRGVVSAGMVAALEELGALAAFDSVYGSSAGAFNGAYLLSRRARLGTTIYYEDANNHNFIDLRRVVGREPILSLDFMLNVIAESIKPIDWERVVDSDIPLHVVATSKNRERAVDLAATDTKDELKRALKATATIPWIAGPPVTIGSDSYLDASVFESIPYHTAEHNGATHVLALRTRPAGVLRGKPSVIERFIIAWQMKRHVPNLVPFYLARAENYAADISELTESTMNPSSKPYRYAVALPEGEKPVSQLEKDRRVLGAAAIAGFGATHRLFDPVEPVVAHELRAFHF